MNKVRFTDPDLKKKIPHRSGVYFFRGPQHQYVYIGKANDLNARIVQHITDRENPKELAIQDASQTIEWRETNSELEALLFEALCIKKYQPHYNRSERDGKTRTYLVIVKDDFPWVTLVRQSHIETLSSKYVFGPLGSARFGRYFIKLLRRSIPFATQRHYGKPCFYAQLKQCDPCPGTIKDAKGRAAYLRSIRRLITLLEGNGNRVMREMEREMQTLSKHHHFEEAAVVRDRLYQLKQLFQRRLVADERLEDPLFIEALRLREQKALTEALGTPPIERLECFDVSTFSAKESVASCVVFINGTPAKNWYRRFRIRGINNFDPAMMREVLERRLAHAEWPLPQVIIIDGGTPQLKAIMPPLRKKYTTLPLIIGIAKHPDRIIHGETFEKLPLPTDSDAMHIVQRIRDEAHRFAKAYHITLRKKLLLPK